MSELLPCPFCGGAPEPEPENNGLGTFWIICDNVGDGCGCEGPYKHSADDAAAAWNRRSAAVNHNGFDLEGVRGALSETYQFASTSPRGRENINFALNELDKLDAS